MTPARVLTALVAIGLGGCASIQPPGIEAGTCRADAIRAEMFGRDTGRTLVVAHRGAHDVVPENSLPAIERAIALGVSVIEMDVRRTADGEYILMHDSTLDRTTDRRGEVVRSSWAELKSARLRQSDGTITRESIPTFAEALEAARGRIWIMIDSKVDTPDEVAAIMRIAREHGMLGQTILYDFKPEVLERYRRLAPEAKVMARTKDPTQIDATIALARPDIFHIEPSYSSVAIAANFDRLHMPTWLNVIETIDQQARAEGDEAAYGQQLSYSPDLIQTDRPAEMIALLRHKGLHPAALQAGRCGKPEAAR